MSRQRENVKETVYIQLARSMVCAQTNTATNLIEPKTWPLLWMEWQEILHEVGHPHLARAVRGWPGSASGTERSHAIHGSASGTEQIAACSLRQRSGSGSVAG